MPGWSPRSPGVFVSVIGESRHGYARAPTLPGRAALNPKEKGDRQLPAKVMQEGLGHSSITMMMDIYGHLFPSEDAAAEPAAEKAFLVRNAVTTSR
jgi:integrase